MGPPARQVPVALETCRADLDRLDEELIRLFVRRMVTLTAGAQLESSLTQPQDKNET